VASLDELSLRDRTFMRRYRHDRFAPAVVPSAALRRPIAEARVALVTSAGLRLPSQPPFDRADRLGDPTFREIPGEIDPAALVEDHRSRAWDHTGLAADRNLALPVDRLRELRSAGRIGPPAPRHLSFMGSIVGPRRLIDETGPAAARLLAADGIDAVLLTPV
jgi:D-proline reductase (dithiol) PrdB